MKHYVVHHPDSYVAMPWRNGLGQTVEILKQSLAGSEQFAWRLSRADVTSDGAFSNFSGYDRTLPLLEGGGITLEFEGGRRSVLTKPLQAASFRGDEPTVATLHAGPIKDFNVMCRTGHCMATVISSNDIAETLVDVHADVLLVYAVGDRLTIDAEDSAPIDLSHQQLLQAVPPLDKTLRVQGAAFIAVQITYC